MDCGLPPSVNRQISRKTYRMVSSHKVDWYKIAHLVGIVCRGSNRDGSIVSRNLRYRRYLQLFF